jgi:hypothetical protein
MKRKVVFIIGSGHCGSTILGLILGSHPNVFSLGEFKTVSTRLKDIKNNIPQICGICMDKCKFWNDTVPLSLLKFYFFRSQRIKFFDSILNRINPFLINIYSKIFEYTKTSILIDSSKSVPWVKQQLKPWYYWKEIEPYLVYICRDGRAVVNSFLRKYPERGIKNLTKEWKGHTIEINKFYQSFSVDRKLKVFYEELATSPNEVIKNICNFLSLDYIDNILKFWKYDNHHDIGGNLGARSLIFNYKKNRNNIYEDISKEFKGLRKSYYQRIGLNIKIDLSWQEELSKEDLDIFNSIAEDINSLIINKEL